MVRESVQRYKDKGLKPDYYVILRNNMMLLFWKETAFSVLLALIAECASVYYNYLVSDIIAFIKDENATEFTDGIKYIVIFVAFMAVG